MNGGPGPIGLLGPGLLLVGLLVLLAGSAPETRKASERLVHRYLTGLRMVRDRFYLTISAERLAALLVGGAVALGVLWFIVSGGLFESLAFFFIGLIIPAVVFQVMWQQRLNQIREQIEPALTLMSSRWRTSPSVGDSFVAIVEHMEAPLSQEASTVVQELQLGDMDSVLRRFEERVPIQPIRLLCMGIRQALPLGGNVAKVLDQIAGAVRESNRLELFVESKTASGRYQAFALALLPILLVWGMWKLDPATVEPLFYTQTGKLLVGFAVVLDVVGVLLVLRITKIEV
ncbi:hypothetical protein L6V77_13910 [Myxococcota bacterium]|nr:hypothetical protein [Myxococcota bacterium]